MSSHWDAMVGRSRADYDPRVVKVAAGWIVGDGKGSQYSARAYATRAEAEAWLHGYNHGASENM